MKLLTFDYRQIILGFCVTLTLTTIGILLAKAGYISTWWLCAIVTPVILFCFHKRKSLSLTLHTVFVSFLISVILACSYLWGYVIYNNILEPPTWDFQVFWLNGRVADEGLNFYDSQSFYSVATDYIKYDQSFEEEVLTPAFRYPPPTMFLFAPLGWFDIHTSIKLWYFIQIACIILFIIILYRLFINQHGWDLEGLLFVATIVMLFSPSLSTIRFAQVNFIMLLMAILALKDKNRPRAGLWLALGIITKPIILLVLLYFFLKRRWQVILSTTVFLFIASVFTVVVFGINNFIPYFTNNPNGKIPSWYYFEAMIQSLFGIVVRTTNFNLSTGSPLFHPLFFIPASLILGITAILIYRNKEENSQTSLYVLTLMTALILYPITQIHYGIFLLIPIFLLWTYRFLLGLWTSIGIITIILAASTVGNQLFWVILFCWIISAIMSGRKFSIRKPHENLSNSPQLVTYALGNKETKDLF